MVNTMRAVVYDKPYAVSIHQVPKPTILHPDDVIVKGKPCPTVSRFSTDRCLVTTTCICGRLIYKAGDELVADHTNSDLHMYEGRTAAAPGIVFGHEK